jgi:hypothetical protein
MPTVYVLIRAENRKLEAAGSNTCGRPTDLIDTFGTELYSLPVVISAEQSRKAADAAMAGL